ncbi:hypothetical protein niasHT_018086 [Heterodera trifolii]|uniref:Uncharacterized protein n=1 Tax=Heterodera trifolii TaxID=157864 RepID=A0ABD2KXY7_9BILA
MVGRGPRQYREGVRADGGRGSVEERASALPSERAAASSGEGAALFNAKYHGPANCIGGRLVNASANHTLGFNPARRNSRAFNAHGTKSRATPIPHPQIPTPHRPAHQPPSRTHISRRIPPPHSRQRRRHNHPIGMDPPAHPLCFSVEKINR